MPTFAAEAFGGLIGQLALARPDPQPLDRPAGRRGRRPDRSGGPARLAPGPPRDPGRRDARRGPGACRDDRLAPPRARAGGRSGRAGDRPRIPRPDRPGIARGVGPAEAASPGDDRAAGTSPSSPLAVAERVASRFVGTIAKSRSTVLVLWSLTVAVLGRDPDRRRAGPRPAPPGRRAGRRRMSSDVRGAWPDS